MKKFVVDVAIGVLIIICLDFIIGKTFQYFYFTQDSGIDYLTTYALDKTEADILVFGSSRANHHYNPKIIEDSLHFSAYNTGRDGEFIFYQTAVLRAVLKRYKPRVMILDFMGTFHYEQEDYDRLSVLLPYYNTHPELRDIILLKSPFEKFKLMSQIYPYNSRLTTTSAGNFEFNKRRISNMDYHGYVPIHNITQKRLDSLRTPTYYEIDDNKIRAFKEFLSLAKENEIPMIVVISPVYYLYKRDYSIDLCRNLCITYDIPFVDFSKDNEFLHHGEYFEDQTHLNTVGADIFTRKVLKLIMNQHFYLDPAGPSKAVFQ